MRTTLIALVVLFLAACAEQPTYQTPTFSDAGITGDAAPVGPDAGCVITIPCVGNACPDQDLQEGLWFPCDLAEDQ